MKHSPEKSVLGEMSEDEIVAEEKHQEKNPDLASVDINSQEGSDVDMDNSVTDPSIQRSLNRLAEDDEELLSDFGEQEEDAEKIK